MKELNRARLMSLLLQPTLQQFEQLEYIVLQDRVLNIMLHSARRGDASIRSRCIALCHLGQWLLLHLSHSKDNLLSHPRIREVLQVLLQALQFRHSRIASIAIDALKLCAERGQQLAAIERVPQLIITSLCKALAIQKDAADKAVLTSLMLCLGEFCMALPLANAYEQDDTLVLQVLRVLLQVATGASPTAEEDIALTIDNEFDMLHIADDSDSEESSDQTAESIQASIRLCARAVAMHLINHLGHFPIVCSDESRVCSMVKEQADENTQQLQLLMLNSDLVASFRELPTLKLPEDELVSAQRQVRVLLRDLNGKACWDVSMLYAESLPKPVAAQLSEKCHNAKLKPQLSLAFDVDPIDDNLAEIEHKSPLRQWKRSAAEAQIMCNILDQRVSEQEFVASTSTCTAFSLLQLDKPVQPVETPFQYCRLLLSHLGLARHSRMHLLQRSEKLMRELRNVDLQKCRETHKLAVIYVAAGQEDKQSILLNTSGSESYEKFIATLGWEIELATHAGFMGGLPRQGCGATAPYYATPFLEVVYHVATRMPSDSNEAMLLKTRHLGNDEVHIVWSEHDCDYRRDIFPTEFCDVLIVVYPLANGLFRVTVHRKPEVPWSGPLLANESVVSGTCLATLVRATAINASRTKRASLPHYQQFYEERHRSLDSVSTRCKISANFVDFTSCIYDPNHAIDATPTIEMLPTSTVPTTEATPASPRPKRRLSKLFKKLTQKHLINKLVIDHSQGDDVTMRSVTFETDTNNGKSSATPQRNSRRLSAMFKGFTKKHLEPVEDGADNNSLEGDSSSGSFTLKAESVTSPRGHRKMSAIFKGFNKQKLREAADNDVDSVSTEADVSPESLEVEADNDKPAAKPRKMSAFFTGFTKKYAKQHVANDVDDDSTEGDTSPERIKLERDGNNEKTAAAPRSGRRLSAMFKGFSKKYKHGADVVDGKVLDNTPPGSPTLSLRSAE